jgi:O-antigen ligase
MSNAKKPNPKPASQPDPAVDTDWRAKLTHVAFVLALATVIARAIMTETLREPFDPAPGSEAAPRTAGPATTLFLNLLCCAPALLILARRTIDPTYVIRLSPSHAIAAAIAVWMFASTFWAADKFAALVHGLTFVSALVLLWSMTQLVRSWQRLRLVAASSFGVFLVYVACGLDYRLIELPEMRKDFEERRTEIFKERGIEPGTFAARQYENKVLGGDVGCFVTSPNSYAAAIVFMGLAAVGVIIQRAVDRDGAGWIIAIVLTFPAAAFVLYHTHSRTAALTPFLGLALLAALWFLRDRLAARHTLAYFTSVALFFLGCTAVIAHGLYHNSLVIQTMTFRWYYWTGAARVLAERPILGTGWSNFGYHYLAARTPVATEEVKDPHNFLVRFAVELGIIGGLLAIAWMLRLWWEMTRPVLLSTTPPTTITGRRGILSITGLALLAVVMNMSLSIDWSITNSAWITLEVFRRAVAGLLLVVGMAVVALRSFKEEKLDDRPAPWLLAGLVVAAGIFLVHNLIDFSLFETGPLFVFSTLVGSVLGLRHPSLAGRMRKPLAPVFASILAVLLFLAVLGFVFAPMAAAESSAAAADDAMRRARFPDAVRLYSDAINHQPLNADYAFRAAQALAYQNSSSEYVRGMVAKAIAANPLAGKYHSWLAGYELSQPQPDAQAITLSFQNALRLNPADVELRLAYADALVKLGDNALAAEQYREALRYDDLLPQGEPKRLPAERRAQISQNADSLSKS